MAEEIHHPHDAMVRAVLSDVVEARSFLQAHLSDEDEVSQGLNWSTLKLLEGSSCCTSGDAGSGSGAVVSRGVTALCT